MIPNIKNNSYSLDSSSKDCKTMLDSTLDSNGNMEYITEIDTLGEGGSISSKYRREDLDFLKKDFREMRNLIQEIAYCQSKLDNYEPENLDHYNSYGHDDLHYDYTEEDSYSEIEYEERCLRADLADYFNGCLDSIFYFFETIGETIAKAELKLLGLRNSLFNNLKSKLSYYSSKMRYNYRTDKVICEVLPISSDGSDQYNLA